MQTLRIAGCIAASLLVSCAYVKSVPEDAITSEKGLRCNMTMNEVVDWASANGMDHLDCPSDALVTRCDAAEGRAQYLLLFSKAGGLISVQPGYVYDLTHLTYEGRRDLCKV